MVVGTRRSRARRALEASCGYKVVEAVVAAHQAEGVRPVDDVLRLPQLVEGLGKRTAVIGGLLVASEWRAPTECIVGRRGIGRIDRGVKLLNCWSFLVSEKYKRTNLEKPLWIGMDTAVWFEIVD